MPLTKYVARAIASGGRRHLPGSAGFRAECSALPFCVLQPTPFYVQRLRAAHAELLTNELVQTHLCGTQFSLDRKSATGLTVALPFGDLEPSEFAHLFAVYEGSRVHAQRERPKWAPEGMYFTVVNGKVLQYKNKIGLVELEEEEGTALYVPHQLFIDQFFLAGDAPELLGTASFALCAITAHLCRLKFIELIAGGGVGFNEKLIGYRVWPKMGFDAPLEDGEAAHVQGAQSVLDVVSADPMWWEENGSQRVMTFDLAPDSRSWEKLLSYLHEKALVT